MTTNKPKIRIALNGTNGRMCQAIAHAVKCDERFQIAFGVDKTPPHINCDFEVYTSFKDVPPCDIVIDFSTPSATRSALEYALSKHLPILVATTGHTSKERQFIMDAGEHIPVFFANNTSLGTYLMLRLVSLASSFLDDSYDIEIVETHHRIKADVPSGTALSIASAISSAKEQNGGNAYTPVLGHKDKRESRQIGIHSVRGGTVVGKHEVLFLGNDERLTITHEAENKRVFVHGALKAADFLIDKPNGVYGMNDLLTD